MHHIHSHSNKTSLLDSADHIQFSSSVNHCLETNYHQEKDDPSKDDIYKDIPWKEYAILTSFNYDKDIYTCTGLAKIDAYFISITMG